MTIEDHTQKAQMILDNTRSLYDRQQAIYAVYFKRGIKGEFERLCREFAPDVVAKTNLIESADPHMEGEVFDAVAKNIEQYLLEGYIEMAEYMDDALRVGYETEDEDNTKAYTETLYIGSAWGVFKYIQDAQGQSYDWALKYGGYSVTEVEQK